MPGDVEAKQEGGRWSSIQGISPAPSETRDGKRAGDNPSSPDKAPSYYDISMLKPPLWTPEVGWYFFFGGLSAGAFVLARLAERFGGSRYCDLTRHGTAIAVAAALPCAPLLIKDLGDPKRFHHMLRVWKPGSPMNLGTWVLTSYTALSVLAELREWVRGRRKTQAPAGVALAADQLVGAATDVAGMPLALLLAGYTAVLISTTAVPVWGKNAWIGPLFSASAISSGAGAISLSLEAQGKASNPDGSPSPASEALHTVETASRFVEAAAHVGYLAVAGPLAKPLTEGPLAKSYWGGAIGAGLAIPEILDRLPVPSKFKRAFKIISGIISLLGGFALRMSFVAAGRPSADDPEAARQASRAKADPDASSSISS